VGGTPARRGKLLLVLEQELSVFDRGERPDYEVIRAVIAYFEVYPDAYHHPQEDMVFKKLNARDPAAAANIGDLAAEHRSGAKRLRRVAQAVESTSNHGLVMADRERTGPGSQGIMNFKTDCKRTPLTCSQKPAKRTNGPVSSSANIPKIIYEKSS